MAENKVYIENDIYVKVKPVDYSKEVKETKESIKEQMNELNDMTNRMGDLGKTTEEEIMDYISKYHQLQNAIKAASISRIDYSGMQSFWYLQFLDGNFALKNIRTCKAEPIIIKGFKSPDEMEKEYRSLRDIMDNEPFIGRKIKAVQEIPGFPECSAFALYELDNVIITGYLDKDNRMVAVALGLKIQLSDKIVTLGKASALEGNKLEELPVKRRVLKLLYKQRLDVEFGD